MEDLSKLCRLCMTVPKTGELTEIFQEQEQSSYPMKIITCLAIEVHKTDQLPKRMCTPCVYLLEKTYIFRKQSRKVDTKFRAFLRKVKTKKISRLDQLSDDEDDDESPDTNVAFVQEYERNMNSGRRDLLNKLKRAIDSLDVDPEPESLAELEISPQEVTIPRTEATKIPQKKKKEEIPEPKIRSPRKKANSRETPTESSAVAFSPKFEKEEEEALITWDVEPEEDESEEEEEEQNDQEEEEQEMSPDSFQGKEIVVRNGLIHACNQCERKFHTKAELVKHARNHLSKKNVCGECGKCFSSSGSLMRHQNIHKNNRSYVCECGKSFTQKGSLIRHALVHQSGSRPFACEDCDKSFSQRHLLTDHVRKAHSDVAVTFLFRCNECPKKFRYSSGLSRHALTHSGKQFQCSECKQVLSDYSALKRHKATLH